MSQNYAADIEICIRLSQIKYLLQSDTLSLLEM